MDIEIRPATAQDASALTEVALAAKRFWGYPEEYIRLWQEDLTITPDTIDRFAIYCALHEHTILGFYALGDLGSGYELEHMWVRPEHIGRGLGRQLLNHATAVARGAGAEALRIVADPNAVGFYHRAGATKVGEMASVPAGRMLPVLRLPLS